LCRDGVAINLIVAALSTLVLRTLKVPHGRNGTASTTTPPISEPSRTRATPTAAGPATVRP